MVTKSGVAKFFEENTQLLGTQKPIEYNLNAGLVHLVRYLDSEFEKLHREIAQIRRELSDVQRAVSRR